MTTLTGTGPLTKLALRRDRTMLVIWFYALTAFVAATVYGFGRLYPTAAGRIGFITAAGHNPALLSFYGPLYGTALGSLTAWRDAAFGSLGTGLMSIFLVVRHTRAEEESGRLELIGSAVVGRHAALVTAMLTACLANLTAATLMAVAAIALGLPAAGTVALVAGIAGCGLVFTGVAAITAQVGPTSRSARGLAIGGLGVVFLLRAVGDSAGQGGPRWLSWLSPVGWAELDRAFGAVRWWVLVLPLVTAVLLAAAARSRWPGGCTARRCWPGRSAAWSTAWSSAPRPRASAACSAVPRSGGSC